jgi:hypothetical protein
MQVIERICPRCQTANPELQHFCGNCGAPFEQPLRRWTGSALALRPLKIPARWRQTGRVIALGAATLAAEAGIAWLRRQQSSYAPPLISSSKVYVLQQRVIERWSKGELQERTLEQTVWLAPDERSRRG